LLLDESAYIDAESPNGTTPLMMAARYGSPEAVKLLIEEGADVHLKNQIGLTALDFAHQGKRPDAIKLIESAIVQSSLKLKKN
jgi:ankyrin repeat protein